MCTVKSGERLMLPKNRYRNEWELAEPCTFAPNEEMMELCWHPIGDPLENASAIDIKLLDFYESGVCL